MPDDSEITRYPARGLRQVLAVWLRAPLERAYLEGYSRAVREHQQVIERYERALDRAHRAARRG